MNIKIGTSSFLNVLHIVSWLLFIALAIDAGGFLFNSLFTIFYNSLGARYFWNNLDLYGVLQFNKVTFIVLASIMSITAILRALLFFMIVKILHDKKLNLKKPFNPYVNQFLFNMTYVVIGIALFSFWGNKTGEWLVKNNVKIPSMEHLKLVGSDIWFFMGITLLVVAQIFKSGVALQKAHELTV